MIDLNFILVKEIEIFAFREKQYDALANHFQKNSDQTDVELAKHYNALVFEYQHLQSLFKFLNEGNELDARASELISRVYESISFNYNSISIIYNSLASGRSDIFWYHYLRDSYAHLAIGCKNEAEKFKC